MLDDVEPFYYMNLVQTWISGCFVSLMMFWAVVIS